MPSYVTCGSVANWREAVDYLIIKISSEGNTCLVVESFASVKFVISGKVIFR